MQISYIGYLSKDIPVDEKTNYAIQLIEDSQALDEVVVVGYGTAKKVNVIGSIASVDSKQLENRATSSVVSALTGQMPGVTITQPGGRPGENTGTIRVRGVGSDVYKRQELSFPRQKQTIHHGHNIHSSAGQTSCSTISRRRI